MQIVNIIAVVAWSLVAIFTLLTRRDVKWWIYLLAVSVIMSVYLVKLVG